MKSAKLVSKPAEPVPMPPEYLRHWIAQYGAGRVLEALDLAYADRVRKEIAASVLDLSPKDLKIQIDTLKAYMDAQKPKA